MQLHTPQLLSIAIINYNLRRREERSGSLVQSKHHDTETECYQDNIFVNLQSIPWISKISGAVHLVQPDLMAGR